MRQIIALLVMLSCFVLLQAQTTAFQPSNPFTGSTWQNSLLNPSKLHISHSASFATTFMNNQSGYQSMYTSHLQYDLSSKLKMNVDLNFVNYGTATVNKSLSFQGNGDNASKLLPSFSMQYKPSDNFVIEFHYQERMMYPYGQSVNSFWRP